MRISDWSSDVCSSDLVRIGMSGGSPPNAAFRNGAAAGRSHGAGDGRFQARARAVGDRRRGIEKPGALGGAAGLFFRLSPVLLDGLQVHRRRLAAAVNFQLELQPVAFVEADHAGALDCRNVDKGIGLAVVAADEAEALHRVEELDGSEGLFAGQLTLRPAAKVAAILARRPFRDGKRLALDLEIGRRDTAAAVDEREFERLAFRQAGEARLLDRRDVHEDILAAIVANDEAEAFLAVEEFNKDRKSTRLNSSH